MRTPLLFATLLAASATMAQNLGEIRGKVFDDAGKPVDMASVSTTLNGQTVSADTDAGGRFVLKPLVPGVYTVTCASFGMKPTKVVGITVTADRATFIDDVVMGGDAGSGRELGGYDVVAYKRKLIDVDDPSRMSLLASEIRKDPNIRNPVQFLAKNFAGVSADADGGLHFRGSRTENMVSFIDGVKMLGAVPNIPPSAISSVSVYTGGLPARYGDVTGGVVVIETKTYAEMYNDRRAFEAQLEKTFE
ncbi:MAG TPA: TonB-dependent receptor [Flavobacteriales bacterium]|nr:TonB-dependent receptor [Flavobacteriales bacterium]